MDNEKKVDLSLLVPEFLLQSQRFRELLELLEENIVEVLNNVDDISDLYRIWEEEGGRYFMTSFIKTFGLDFGYLWFSDYQVFIDAFVDFLKRKGSYCFIDLLRQVRANVMLTDLSEFCLRWSEGKAWDVNLYEDAMYYRDKSLLIEGKVTPEFIEKTFPVGVMVWLVMFFGLILAKFVFSLSVAGVTDWTFFVRRVTRLLMVHGMGLLFSYVVRNRVYEDYEEYRHVVNERVVVLS